MQHLSTSGLPSDFSPQKKLQVQQQLQMHLNSVFTRLVAQPSGPVPVSGIPVVSTNNVMPIPGLHMPMPPQFQAMPGKIFHNVQNREKNGERCF